MRIACYLHDINVYKIMQEKISSVTFRKGKKNDLKDMTLRQGQG